MKLDAKTVAALTLPVGKADAIHFDEALPGFGLRLRAGGKRSYIAQYRIDGQTRRVKIGSADLLTAEQARAAARKILAAVTLGADPQAERRQKRDQAKVTLRSIAETYLAAREGKVRPRTIYDLRRYLTGPYLAPLHAMPVDAVERKHIADCILRIEHENGMAAARRARAALSALFAWSMRAGLASSNPLIGAYAPDVALSRDRVLSNSEMTAIWHACGDDAFGRIVRLLILTGQRRTEIGGMAWSELDLEAGTWTLPAARSKNGRQHVLPLPASAWEIITAVPRRVERDKLFGDRAPAGFVRWGPAKLALDERLACAASRGGTVGPWTLHDLRRSVATGMADIGVAPHVIEQILNHQSGHRRGVVGIYNRSSYERETRAALALWADHVRTLVEGGERTILSFPQESRQA